MMTKTQKCSAFATTLVAAMGAFASPAAAQYQVDQFDPLHGQGNNVLNLSKSETLGHLIPSAGLIVHFQDDPFTVETTGGDSRARLIDHQLKAEVLLGLGILDRFDIGVAVPVVLSQSGDGFDSVGVTDVSGATMGDIRIIPKARLFTIGGFGAAVLAPIYIPTGEAASFNSDGKARIAPRLALDFATEHFTVIGNFGVHLRPRRVTLNYTSGPAFTYGLGAEVPLFSKVSAIASYYGSIGLEKGRDPLDLSQAASNSHANPMELLLGAQVDLPANLVAQLGAGPGLTSSVGTPDFRIFAGLSYTPRGVDSDGDGIYDHSDDCPAEPEDKDGFKDRDGCPDIDNDQDGILDEVDQCRDDAEDKDGFQDEDGCPDLDNDGDGVKDVDDACPDTPGDKSNKGCPLVDSDGDGIYDGSDQCPNDPEDKDGFQDEDGCPDPDNDRDGVLDADDKCPTEKEVINGVDDEDGCPDEGESKVRVTETSIEILEKVFFDLNKATIKPRSQNVLNQVALILKANPQITKVRVEGHTDTVGADDYNMQLSQQRAESVRDYLVGRGVASKRLEPVGFGETRPLQSNDTRPGREANRRVEFNIIEIDGKPANSQVIQKN